MTPEGREGEEVREENKEDEEAEKCSDGEGRCWHKAGTQPENLSGGLDLPDFSINYAWAYFYAFWGFYNRNEFIWMEGVEPGRPPINAWFKALFTRFLGFDI